MRFALFAALALSAAAARAQVPAPMPAAPSLAVGAGQAVGTLITLADFGFVAYDTVDLVRGGPPARGVMKVQLVFGLAQAAASLGIAGYFASRREPARVVLPALGLAAASLLLSTYAAVRLQQTYAQPVCTACASLRF